MKLSKGSLQGPEAPTPSWAAPSSCLTSCGPVNGQFSPRNSARRRRAHTQLTPTPPPTSRQRDRRNIFLKKASIQKNAGTFLAVQWWGLCRGSGLIPGQGTQILQACSAASAGSTPCPQVTPRSADGVPATGASRAQLVPCHPHQQTPPGALATTLQTQRLTRPGLPDQTAPHC